LGYLDEALPPQVVHVLPTVLAEGLPRTLPSEWELYERTWPGERIGFGWLDFHFRKNASPKIRRKMITPRQPLEL
jgi:hypothetical protein